MQVIDARPMAVSRCRRFSAKWCGLSSCRGTQGPPPPFGILRILQHLHLCWLAHGFDVIVPVVCRAKNSILYWLTDDHILYILNNIEWWEMPHLQADLDRILHPPKPSVTAKVSAAGAAAGKVVSGAYIRVGLSGGCSSACALLSIFPLVLSGG